MLNNHFFLDLAIIKVIPSCCHLQVKEAAESLQDGIIAQACGSYRRGKPTCGDVDVLITHPDGKSHKGIFHKLLVKLKESGMQFTK